MPTCLCALQCACVTKIWKCAILFCELYSCTCYSCLQNRFLVNKKQSICYSEVIWLMQSWLFPPLLTSVTVIRYQSARHSWITLWLTGLLRRVRERVCLCVQIHICVCLFQTEEEKAERDMRDSWMKLEKQQGSTWMANEVSEEAG